MSIAAHYRIGVVAADPLRALGLLAILEESLGAETLELELSAVFEDHTLDALLLDSRFTIEELVDLIARLRRERPTVKVVAMGAALDAVGVQSIIGAGAKGYLAETAGEAEIKMAMEVVLDGSIWAPRKVLAKLIDAGGVYVGGTGTTGARPVEELMTPRELEVLNLLMDGRSNREIAESMSIDEVTVKAHLGRMLRKTRSSNRVELTLRAIEERTARTRTPSGD